MKGDIMNNECFRNDENFNNYRNPKFSIKPIFIPDANTANTATDTITNNIAITFPVALFFLINKKPPKDIVRQAVR